MLCFSEMMLYFATFIIYFGFRCISKAHMADTPSPSQAAYFSPSHFMAAPILLRRISLPHSHAWKNYALLFYQSFYFLVCSRHILFYNIFIIDIHTAFSEIFVGFQEAFDEKEQLWCILRFFHLRYVTTTMHTPRMPMFSALSLLASPRFSALIKRGLLIKPNSLIDDYIWWRRGEPLNTKIPCYAGVATEELR